MDPPCYTRVGQVVDELHGSISGLASARKGSTFIDEVLDVTFIKEQIKKGVFSWGCSVKLVEDVVSILDEMRGVADATTSMWGGILDQLRGTGTQRCAAEVETLGNGFSALGRINTQLKSTSVHESWEAIHGEMQDAITDETKQPKAFCGALEFLFVKTKAILVEVGNERLRIISPVIKDHGIEYMQNYAGSLSLGRTRTWLRAVISTEVCSGRLLLSDLTVNDTAKTSSFTKVFHWFSCYG